MTSSGIGSAGQVAYARDACSYDGRTAAFRKYRQDTVDRLPKSRGDVVLDVGCGTGLCFEYVRDEIGPDGHIVGIDGSGPMLDLAAERVRDQQWDNVTLLHSAAQDAQIPVRADAALFCAAHDILQSRPALDNVFRHLRPGAWVAASGGKWAPTWKAALNVGVFAAHEPFVASFDGFARPWALLQQFVEDLTVRELGFGTGYVAVGRVPSRSAA